MIFADRVDKVPDGSGYDILSFKTDGSEKHIEVKTTSGERLRPFFISDNEWAFMKDHPNSFYLYRIFKYNKALNKGKVFILKGDLDGKVIVRGKQFEVFLRSGYS